MTAWRSAGLTLTAPWAGAALGERLSSIARMQIRRPRASAEMSASALIPMVRHCRHSQSLHLGRVVD
ncbi:hypothetical protein MRB53_040600 [Persea americana]|nr:hypothetical protein MRB53_040600 [Persea americana]